jgi:hypothetical protein
MFKNIKDISEVPEALRPEEEDYNNDDFEGNKKVESAAELLGKL